MARPDYASARSLFDVAIHNAHANIGREEVSLHSVISALQLIAGGLRDATTNDIAHQHFNEANSRAAACEIPGRDTTNLAIEVLHHIAQGARAELPAR